MAWVKYLVAVLLFSALAWGQFTLVTGTVVDPNGLPYANGAIGALLILPGGASPTLNGLAYTPPVQPTGLNAAGVFSMRLADNTVLLPAGTKWNFTVCSALGTVQPASGNGPRCFSVTLIISGASQDISAQLTGAALPLSGPFATVPGPFNPTVGIPGSTLSLSIGSAQTTTIGDANSSTSVLDLASTIDFKPNQGICVTGAGSVATIHCGAPGASGTSDCVSSVASIFSGNKVSISPPCTSAPASGATVYHDDALALRAVLNLCNASTTQAFLMPNGIWYANAAPVAVNGSNFILPLPVIGTPQGTHIFGNGPITVCEFIGQTRPAISATGNPVPNVGPQIVTANTATNYSLIGGRGTGLAGCGGTCSNFDFIDFESTNMRWMVPTNTGNGIMCGYVSRCNVRRSILSTWSEPPASVPTNGFGYIMPYVGNANQSSFEDSEVYGYQVGVLCWDHAYLENNRFGYLSAGIEIGTNAVNIDNGLNQPSGHNCTGVYNDIEAVQYAIAPALDPTTSTLAGGPFDLQVDLEHFAGTFAPVEDIHDPTNLLTGRFSYLIRPPFDVVSPATLILNGGLRVNRCSIQDDWCTGGINVASMQWQAGGGTLVDGVNVLPTNLVSISQNGASFVFTPPASTAWGVKTLVKGFYTSTISNFTGHSVTFCPTSTLLASDNADIAGFFMAKDYQDYIDIELYNGKIYFVKDVAGTLTILNGAGSGETYPGTTGTFTCVQLAESSGAFTFKTSTSFGGTLNTDTTCAATCVGWSYTSAINQAFILEGVAGNTTPAIPGGVKFDPIQVQ